MNGLSVISRTASTSISIFAVSSAITSLSGKPVIVTDPFFGSLRNDGHSIALLHHLPLDRLAAAIDESTLVRARHLDVLGRRPRRFRQRNRVGIRRQPIMLRPVERGKGFELVQRPFLLE